MAEIHVVFLCYKYTSQPDQQVNGEDTHTHTHTPLAGELQRHGIWIFWNRRERGEGVSDRDTRSLSVLQLRSST